MELHIVIAGEKDLAGQVYRQIRDAIQSGRLTDGEQIPPSRLLAQQLGVSRKTVSEAYTRLTLDKLLRGKIGAGTFVNIEKPHRQSAKKPVVKRNALAASASIERWLQHTIPFQHGTPSQYELIGGSTSKNHFPQHEWRRCMLHGLRMSAASAGSYAAAEGLAPLRESIARHISFARGVRCTASDVIVTSGAQQAIDLIARVVIEAGCTVAVEDPGYPPARLLFSSHGASIAYVPVDEEGMLVDQIPDGTRLIYTTPAHQFPLGMPMSQRRRTALLQRAAELGALIIEDDYDSEFRYEGRPADSLQSMDKQGSVVFVGTFSKIMQPGLRIGYMIAPAAIREAIIIAKHLSDWHTSAPMQWALNKFIDDGLLQKHIRRCHTLYSHRREKIMQRMRTDLAPWFAIVPANAGFHLTALAQAEFDLQLLIRLARRVGIGLYSIDGFYQQAEVQQGLLIGYGAIETLDIGPAFDRIHDILREIS